MGNTRRNKPRQPKVAPRPKIAPQAQRTGPGTPLAAIAEETGEDPVDIEAALVTLVTAGNDFDVVWEWMREAVEEGKGIVQMATERLGSVN